MLYIPFHLNISIESLFLGTDIRQTRCGKVRDVKGLVNQSE